MIFWLDWALLIAAFLVSNGEPTWPWFDREQMPFP
jgi:hypothetical protein